MKIINRIIGLFDLGSYGDTIVEVLFAITIITTVLSASYAVTLRSLNNELNSQERTSAIQLVQTQIEDLRVYIGSNSLPSLNTAFCFYNNGTSGVSLGYPGTSSAPSTDCQQDSSGNPNATTSPYFNVSIDQTSSGSFVIVATWSGAGGTGQDNVTMYYLMYTS